MLHMEEHSALTQYGLEQLHALHKLCRELEKKVLQLKVPRLCAAVVSNAPMDFQLYRLPSGDASAQ